MNPLRTAPCAALALLAALPSPAASAAALVFEVLPQQTVTLVRGGFIIVETEYDLVGGLVVEVHDRTARAIPAGMAVSNELNPPSDWPDSLGDDLFGFLAPDPFDQIRLEGVTLNGEAELVLDHVAGDRWRLTGRLESGDSFWTVDVEMEHAATVEGTALRGGRFAIEGRWRTAADAEGAAHGRAITRDGAIFWFFRPSNPELLVKVLDACAAFGQVWVFAAGVTDVGVELTVTDRETGASWSRTTVAGQPFGHVLDTAALPCAPPPG